MVMRDRLTYTLLILFVPRPSWPCLKKNINRHSHLAHSFPCSTAPLHACPELVEGSKGQGGIDVHLFVRPAHLKAPHGNAGSSYVHPVNPARQPKNPRRYAGDNSRPSYCPCPKRATYIRPGKRLWEMIERLSFPTQSRQSLKIRPRRNKTFIWTGLIILFILPGRHIGSNPIHKYRD